MARKTPASGFSLHSFSIVLLAEYHNPTILTDNFLRKNKIVPEAWNVAVSLRTPEASTVRYEEGLNIVSERERLQFVERLSAKLPSLPKAVSASQKYLENVPHVQYRQVGVNFGGHMSVSTPVDWISQNFTTLNNRDKSPLKIEAVNVAIRYKAKEGVCNLQIGDGKLNIGQDLEKSVVGLTGNFHHDLANEDYELAIAAIKMWKDHKKEYQTILKHVLGRQIRI